MKKSILTFMFFVVCVFGFSPRAQAVVLPFNDLIDNWTYLGFPVDSLPIFEGAPFTYTHDISSQISGGQVLSANLELDFTNDFTDVVIFGFDNREFVTYGIYGDNNAVVDLTGSLGEVDNGQYDLVMNIDWLNDDGKFDVRLTVSNPGFNSGLTFLDHSRLYGTYEEAQAATSTPEPASMLLLGSGLVGGVFFRRKK